jgi:hypothetical protein
MPIAHKPADGFEESRRWQVREELASAWEDYIKDCRDSNTRPELVDFGVWMLHLSGFRAGMAFASDDGDDPQGSGENGNP